MVHSHLVTNLFTQHLRVDRPELEAVLVSLDLAILNARLENNEQWGTPLYYKKLRKMLKGYLVACE
jgi:hypothetical protein